MNPKRNKPFYDLNSVKRLAKQSRIEASIHVYNWFINHGYVNVDDTMCSIVLCIEDKHFHKSDELEKKPGTWADIYHHFEYYDEEWYTKFFIEPYGKPDLEVLNVWSLVPDGQVH